MIITFNNKIIAPNGKWLCDGTPVDPYNPLGLPDKTIRVKFKAGYTPTMGDTQTLVDAENNVWDITNNHAMWHYLFRDCYDLLEVLGANTTGVTSMYFLFENCHSLSKVALFDTSTVNKANSMFRMCYALTSVPKYDTSNMSDIRNMFSDCTSLTEVPLFDTSKATDMGFFIGTCTSLRHIPLFDTSSVVQFEGFAYQCVNVESGALAIYQQASSQAVPPADYGLAFTKCGINTSSGIAERAQIPTTWGGDMQV